MILYFSLSKMFWIWLAQMLNPELSLLANSLGSLKKTVFCAYTCKLFCIALLNKSNLTKLINVKNRFCRKILQHFIKQNCMYHTNARSKLYLQTYHLCVMTNFLTCIQFRGKSHLK